MSVFIQQFSNMSAFNANMNSHSHSHSLPAKDSTHSQSKPRQKVNATFIMNSTGISILTTSKVYHKHVVVQHGIEGMGKFVATKETIVYPGEIHLVMPSTIGNLLFSGKRCAVQYPIASNSNGYLDLDNPAPFFTRTTGADLNLDRKRYNPITVASHSIHFFMWVRINGEWILYMFSSQFFVGRMTEKMTLYVCNIQSTIAEAIPGKFTCPDGRRPDTITGQVNARRTSSKFLPAARTSDKPYVNRRSGRESGATTQMPKIASQEDFPSLPAPADSSVVNTVRRKLTIQKSKAKSVAPEPAVTKSVAPEPVVPEPVVPEPAARAWDMYDGPVADADIDVDAVEFAKPETATIILPQY